MLRKILKVLADSITSVTGGVDMNQVAKDIMKQEIGGYPNVVRNEPTRDCPMFTVGQLVKIKFHHQFKRHHQEVGIITEVCDFDPIQNGPTMNFYEVLVGDEKITIIERYLDGNVEIEEESSEE